jgi:hypothetical protein
MIILIALILAAPIILPIYLVWLILGLINPRTRNGVRIINSILTKLIITFVYLVIGFVIGLFIIMSLAFLLVPLSK